MGKIRNNTENFAFLQNQKQRCGEFYQRNCERPFFSIPSERLEPSSEKGSSLLTKIQGVLLIYLAFSAEGISLANRMKKPHYSGSLISRESLEQNRNKKEARKILNLAKNSTEKQMKTAFKTCVLKATPNDTDSIRGCLDARKSLQDNSFQDTYLFNGKNQTKVSDRGVVVPQGTNSTIDKVQNASQESIPSKALPEESTRTWVSLLNRISRKVKASNLNHVANRINAGVETITTTSLGLGLLGPMSFLVFSSKVKADFEIPSIAIDDIKGIRELIDEAETTQDPGLLSKLESIKYGIINNAHTFWDRDEEIRPYTAKFQSIFMQSPKVLNDMSLGEVLDCLDLQKNPPLEGVLKPSFAWVTEKAVDYAEWKEENPILSTVAGWGGLITTRAGLGCALSAEFGCLPGAAVGAVEGVGEIVIGSVANAIFGKPIKNGMEYVLDNAVVPTVQFLDPTITDTEAAIATTTITSVALHAVRFKGIVNEFKGYNAMLPQVKTITEGPIGTSIRSLPEPYDLSPSFMKNFRFSDYERSLLHPKVEDCSFVGLPSFKDAFAFQAGSGLNYMLRLDLSLVRGDYVHMGKANFLEMQRFGSGLDRGLFEFKYTPIKGWENMLTGNIASSTVLNFGSTSLDSMQKEGVLANDAGQLNLEVESFSFDHFVNNLKGSLFPSLVLDNE